MYGDELGPTIEFLRAQGKSWEEIKSIRVTNGRSGLGAGEAPMRCAIILRRHTVFDTIASMIRRQGAFVTFSRNADPVRAGSGLPVLSTTLMGGWQFCFAIPVFCICRSIINGCRFTATLLKFDRQTTPGSPSPFRRQGRS